MKVAAIIYHKNILSIYKRKWIDDCMNSLKNQTYKDFIVYELNYGDDGLNLCKEYEVDNEYHFYEIKMNNHAEAMNFLLNECLEDGVDFVFNNNMDDFSENERFEIQLDKIKEGYDIVSSDFIFIDGNGKKGKKMIMSEFDPKIELQKSRNIICHPSVCYSRKFLLDNKYGVDEIPEEDLLLWKRTVSDFRFFICDKFLINYRFHQNQITTKHKFKNDKLAFTIESNRLMEKMGIDTVTLRNRVPIGNTTVRKGGLYNCICGEKKDKIKYNFCQRCNKIY